MANMTGHWFIIATMIATGTQLRFVNFGVLIMILVRNLMLTKGMRIRRYGISQRLIGGHTRRVQQQ